MKTVLNLSLAAVLATSSIVAATAPAMADRRHHHDQMGDHMACMDQGELGGIIVLGLVLGAVTGGVGSAVVWGSAYAVGGAAVGGATGLALGAIHSHHHCE